MLHALFSTFTFIISRKTSLSLHKAKTKVNKITVTLLKVAKQEIVYSFKQLLCAECVGSFISDKKLQRGIRLDLE